MKHVFRIDEDIRLLYSRMCDLEKLNEDFDEKYFTLMFDMFPEIDDMESVIQKVGNSADASVDKYNETIEVNKGVNVRVNKYNETIEVNNGTDVRLDKYSDNSQRSSA